MIRSCKNNQHDVRRLNLVEHPIRPTIRWALNILVVFTIHTFIPQPARQAKNTAPMLLRIVAVADENLGMLLVVSGKRLHRNPLHNVPRDDVFGVVVQVGRPRVRVTQQTLHVLPRNPLADEVGGHWLIDVVASHQPKAKVHGEPFQLWAIKLDGKGGCVVTMRRDTGERPIVRQVIEYTDFPEDFEWFACDNGQGHTMLLKSEY